MNENAVRIQIVMSALEGLNVPATAGNTEKLTVIWQLLGQVRDELAAAPQGSSGTGSTENPDSMPE